MSDDTSLDEAMAAARSDDERELTSQQLDAFHATFNFCMTCRQYTCANCWNDVEGRCLTCAPHLGHEILPAPFPDLPGFSPMRCDRASGPGRRPTSAAEADAPAGAGGPTRSTWPTGSPAVGDREPSSEVDAAARLEPVVSDAGRARPPSPSRPTAAVPAADAEPSPPTPSRDDAARRAGRPAEARPRRRRRSPRSRTSRRLPC